jgi:ribosomal protein S18 acetylase RimI-like enzyme
MKPLSITQATRRDGPAISSMAREIWSEHYTPVIGKEQVDYMLEKFQSPEAISEQIDSGYEYYLVRKDGQNVGYFALLPAKAEKKAQLSKIYVHANARRTGVGQRIIAFCERRCAELGLNELWLTVNRHNTGSIAFYKKNGFSRTRKLVQDIGNGFVMDDYVMTKHIDSTHF